MRKYTLETANDGLSELRHHATNIFALIQEGRNTDRVAKLGYNGMWGSVLSAFKHGSEKQAMAVSALSVIQDAPTSAVDRKVTFAANYIVCNVPPNLACMVPLPVPVPAAVPGVAQRTAPIPVVLTKSQEAAANAERMQSAITPVVGKINNSGIDRVKWSCGATEDCVPKFGENGYVEGVKSIYTQMTGKTDVPNQTYSPDGGISYNGWPIVVQENKETASSSSLNGAKVAATKPLELLPVSYLLVTDCHGATFHQLSAVVDTDDYSKNKIEVRHIPRVDITFGNEDDSLINYIHSVKEVTTVMVNIIHEILDGFPGLELAMTQSIRTEEWSIGIQKHQTKVSLSNHPELYAFSKEKLENLPKPDPSLSINPTGVRAFQVTNPRRAPIPGIGGKTGRVRHKTSPTFLLLEELNPWEYGLEVNRDLVQKSKQQLRRQGYLLPTVTQRETSPQNKRQPKQKQKNTGSLRKKQTLVEDREDEDADSSDSFIFNPQLAHVIPYDVQKGQSASGSRSRQQKQKIDSDSYSSDSVVGNVELGDFDVEVENGESALGSVLRSKRGYKKAVVKQNVGKKPKETQSTKDKKKPRKRSREMTEREQTQNEPHSQETSPKRQKLQNRESVSGNESKSQNTQRGEVKRVKSKATASPKKGVKSQAKAAPKTGTITGVKSQAKESPRKRALRKRSFFAGHGRKMSAATKAKCALTKAQNRARLME